MKSTTPSPTHPTQAQKVKGSLVKTVEQWAVADVCAYLEGLQLGHLAQAVRDNALSGADLLALSQEELVTDLGWTKLQVRWLSASCMLLVCS